MHGPSSELACLFLACIDFGMYACLAGTWHAVCIRRDRGAGGGLVPGGAADPQAPGALLHLHEGARLSPPQHPWDTVRQSCRGASLLFK